MTKIDALLRRLLLLRDRAPDEKSLVFSQFPAALELVSFANPCLTLPTAGAPRRCHTQSQSAFCASVGGKGSLRLMH